MSKISAEQLARSAYVYVRQSTADQLRHNPESRRRQYALAERARALGWSEVIVIDDDLGVSASGVARPGFERLLAAICSGSVGAVVSIEASRLARNGRDWHTLLEFCALVGSVIIDEEGVYDPRSANDRLLLGMKGTISEMELSLLRQRSVEALKLKAARGELHSTVAIGFVRTHDDRIEKDPDLRIREALSAVFNKFAELRSARQVLLWFRDEAINLPAAVNGPGGRSVLWRAPIYNTVLHILTNPVYAGAYAFGRTETRVRIEAGRKRVINGIRRERDQWQVLITEHHEGYIDWQTYEHNQRVIAENANMKGEMARGALRKGEALLAGLLRCGHCGRKLHVAYTGKNGNTSRYVCRGAAINHGASGKCIAFGSIRIDQGVSAEVPPGVRIVVASNFSMANCPAASFHDKNTAFTSLTRIQRAGTAQSQASRHAFRYQHCWRAQHVRWHSGKWLQSASKKTAIAHPVFAATAALDGPASAWSPAQRLMALQQSYALDDMARSGWCREHGVFEHQLVQWHQEFCTPAVPASREASAAFRELQRQHEQLQRELRRKEKALAEVAALLVLQKNF